MKLDRKGFTLVELLVTIVIVGLILGFSAYGIIKVVNSSNEKVAVLSADSLKEAARIYSAEASSDSWKNAGEDDAFCVTIEELMNKGLLDANAQIEGKTQKSDYIIVKRNKITLAVEKEEIVSNIIGDENNKICTGQVLEPEEEVEAPVIGDSTRYTDKIVVNFTPGSATYQGEGSTTTYKCFYGTESGNINSEGKIEGNTCVADNLKNNTDYYIAIYMDTNHGSSIAAEGNNYYRTADFYEPVISYSGNVATITYNIKDTNDNYVNNPEPCSYFKSNVIGISDIYAEECQLEDGEFICDEVTNNIRKDTWYRILDTEVKITFPESDNDVKINASIYDGSNNHSDSEKEFIIRKYTVSFYKGSADSIDGSTNSYVTKSCVGSADKGASVSCSITSPSIVRSGYTIVGWNTSSSAKSSSWKAGYIRSVSANATYYPITKKTATITFKANGATIGATSGSCTMWNTDTTCSVTSPSITRSGYTVVGWNTSSSATSSTWDVSTAKNVSANATYYAITNKNVTITFNGNGGTASATSGSCTIWNSATSCSVTSPSITRSGYTVVGWNTSSGATSSSWSVNTAKDVSANATYYAITNKNVTITFNGNGGTAGTTSGSCTIWNSATSCSVTSPSATRSGYTMDGWNTSSGATSSSWSVNTAKDVSANATYYAVWKANSETINANKFVCETNRLAVYYVTTCNNGVCTYNKKNGLNNTYNFSLDTTGTPTWSINKSTYSDSLSGIGSNCTMYTYYITASSGLNCRSGASTSNTSIDYTWSQCTSIDVYRTTMKIDSSSNWYYSSNYGCYLSGEYLSSSNPCSGSGGCSNPTQSAGNHTFYGTNGNTCLYVKPSEYESTGIKNATCTITGCNNKSEQTDCTCYCSWPKICP